MFHPRNCCCKATHCRCSRCFAAPPRRRVRKRPCILTLLNLPEDVLLYILECLPVPDILSMRKVHPYLGNLIDTCNSIWTRASFRDIWPSPENLHLFERAAEYGNFEASVKLGIAYLYNEGLSMSDDGRAEVNGLKASHFFGLAEKLNTRADPFVWLFIRPPWSSSGSCCKAVVFDSLKDKCENVTSEVQTTMTLKGSIQYCLGKVLNLFEDEEKKREALRMYEASAANGCLHSSYLLWESNSEISLFDPGRSLESLRKLRDCAAKGVWDAQMSLAIFSKYWKQLGQEQRWSHELVSRVFQSSQPFNKKSIFTKQKGLNDTMRYILIDWLVEVATMKDFSSLCLHMTVDMVDRYLKQRFVQRGLIQLVGIACMVLCTRFMSKEILTIREAVWLTDNTYTYEDLVRMMGEIISVLEGKIRMPTVVDYKDLLLHVTPLDGGTLSLCSYISELSLLYTELSVYSPAQIAAGSLLLARILHKQALPWPSHLAESTGYTLESLTPCVLLIHKKCFHSDAPKDYRKVPLTAVRQRFQLSAQTFNEEVMEHSQLCAFLGAPHPDKETPVTPLNAADVAFLCSPSGSKTKRKREDSIQEDRSSFVTTPTSELSNQEEALLGDFLEWSLDSSSGYEGDWESEDDREGDVSVPSGILDISVLNVEHDHCQDSSDEDVPITIQLPPLQSKKDLDTQNLRGENSSGYSSVSSGGSPTSSPTESPFNLTSRQSQSRLVPIPYLKPCIPHTKPRYKQVKRKNQAPHSDDITHPL
ncbi:cyclin-F isoform X2 [Bombina bombina]|uniref:cyclin-F isoform X2 n=1 Tax=Bombina bombina TaxID=8345 RepID=UPI00235AF6AE|nr:cyclin-F isoform X2 [Bombina bombina]